MNFTDIVSFFVQTINEEMKEIMTDDAILAVLSKASEFGQLKVSLVKIF